MAEGIYISFSRAVWKKKKKRGGEGTRKNSNCDPVHLTAFASTLNNVMNYRLFFPYRNKCVLSRR